MSTTFEHHTFTGPTEPLVPEAQPVPLQERLDGLVLEQIAIIDLLSRGLKKSETAADRQAQVVEVAELAKQTAEYLGAGTIHGATYILLEAGLLIPSAGEADRASDRVAQLSDRQRRYVTTLMSGATYEQASERLGLSERSLRTYTYAGVNKVLGTHSLPETTRLAYAAGLRPGQGETSAKNAEEAPVSLSNVNNFVAWMYPKEDLNGLGELTEQEARALVQLLTEEIDSLVRDNPGSAKAIRTGGQTVRDWLGGQSLFQIAKSRGKTEGSIMLGLTGFAAKLGNRNRSTDIYEQTKLLSGQKIMEDLKREIFTPEEAEDRLVPGESTVLDVVTAIRRGLPGRKLPFSGEYQEGPPQLDEAELVTLLNVYRVPMRVQKIVRLISAGDDSRSDLYSITAGALDGLSRTGQILDLGDGRYQSKEWVEYEEVEETRPTEASDQAVKAVVEETPPTTRGGSGTRPRQDYSEDLSRYRRQLYGPGKAGELTEMLREAGIPADTRPRLGKRKRR